MKNWGTQQTMVLHFKNILKFKKIREKNILGPLGGRLGSRANQHSQSGSIPLKKALIGCADYLVDPTQVHDIFLSFIFIAT